LNFPVGLIGDRVGLAKLLDGLVLLPLATSVLMIFLKPKSTTAHQKPHAEL